MIRRLALAVGDTAGHVLPALAIAEAYMQLFSATDIRFFAAGDGAGHWLIERSGFPLDYVPGSQIARATRARQMTALWRTGLGVARSRTLLSQHGTRLVIGTGGYGSAGALLAARSLGLRTALVEPNVVPGLANRLLGRVAHRAYVAFEETARTFPPGRSLVTGVPIRRGIGQADVARTPPAFPRLRVLVMSGSRGEHFLGNHVPPLCDALTQNGIRVEVRHQGGTATTEIQRSYDRLGIQARVEPFIEDVPNALSWADMAIARAGAGTIAELAAAGIPSLLVPLGDAAHDHQALNAAALVSRGAAVMTREEEWLTQSLATRISDLVRDSAAWMAMSHSIRRLADLGGADRVVRDCETLMEGRW